MCVFFVSWNMLTFWEIFGGFCWRFCENFVVHLNFFWFHLGLCLVWGGRSGLLRWWIPPQAHILPSHYRSNWKILRWLLQCNPAVTCTCTTSYCHGWLGRPWSTCWPRWRPPRARLRNGAHGNVQPRMDGVTWPSPWGCCFWRWRSSPHPKPSCWNGTSERNYFGGRCGGSRWTEPFHFFIVFPK